MVLRGLWPGHVGVPVAAAGVLGHLERRCCPGCRWRVAKGQRLGVLKIKLDFIILKDIDYEFWIVNRVIYFIKY